MLEMETLADPCIVLKWIKDTEIGHRVLIGILSNN
jgi:hypothetical protein